MNLVMEMPVIEEILKEKRQRIRDLYLVILVRFLSKV